jgi:molecular chaperone GrpE (heat shock protein)
VSCRGDEAAVVRPEVCGAISTLSCLAVSTPGGLKKLRIVACFFSMKVVLAIFFRVLSSMMIVPRSIRGSLRSSVSWGQLSKKAQYIPHAPFRGFCSKSNAADDSDAKQSSDTEAQDAPQTDSTPEDREYAQALEALQKAEQEAKSLHRNLLLKYADAENKRRERVEDIKKLDTKHVSAFGKKVSEIFESLTKVCDTAQSKAAAPTAGEKVKSFSEGLVMTRDIMKNILAKHSILK